MKKEEIAVRDRDIAELTQQVNSLDRQVNELGEFNEMLCERLGVGAGENVGFAEWRAKKEGERGRLREENQSLRKEVKRLCVVCCGRAWSICGPPWSLIYSGTSLIQTPLGQKKVSLLVRCPDFRGCKVHVHKQGVWDSPMCPVYRGVLISGVS